MDDELPRPESTFRVRQALDRQGGERAAIVNGTTPSPSSDASRVWRFSETDRARSAYRLFGSFPRP